MDSPSSPGSRDRLRLAALQRLAPCFDALEAASTARTRSSACETARAAVEATELALGDEADDSFVLCNALRLPVEARMIGLANGSERLAAWRAEPDETLEVSRRAAALLARRAHKGTLYVLTLDENLHLMSGYHPAHFPDTLIAVAVLEVLTYWPLELRNGAEGRHLLATALRSFSKGRVHDFSERSMHVTEGSEARNHQMMAFAVDCVLRRFSGKQLRAVLRAAEVDELSLRALRRHCFKPLSRKDDTPLRELVEDALGPDLLPPAAVEPSSPSTPQLEQAPDRAPGGLGAVLSALRHVERSRAVRVVLSGETRIEMRISVQLSALFSRS